ncbi:hypothetical protein DFA_04646 [Cavenderia fasciculata]|uniref:HD/PDEase domain-containing protein n=1 Tax=Cavenderia fasciculata TaxID=261658 RepID=F4PQ55_CACFS|nr:uncharacterized protein DFA_04646 [Cavenderia fasciculata]EGG22518.1 hypothetical protein DFA_04646 [Cavenderia fasciculata]|eukprot:XP_004360369.1 hypothetical protein DFA_04646 [Cavenderia fasciculata]
MFDKSIQIKVEKEDKDKYLMFYDGTIEYMSATATGGRSTRMLMNKIIDFVKNEMKNNDPSHDFKHVERVVDLTRQIAKSENYQGDMELLEVAAYLHDVNDWKYSGSETAGVEAARLFLADQSYPEDKIEKVCQIIQDISFKNELGNTSMKSIPIESMIVQDADRLDAMGAVGVARTFSYGALKKNTFYEEETFQRTIGDKTLTKDEYMKTSRAGSSTLDHFYDKLFILKDRIKTQTGKRMAQERHQFIWIERERDKQNNEY